MIRVFFNVIIVADFAFNVITGGGFDTCFSTRAYYNEHTKGGIWVDIRKAVDFIMCENRHCEKSFAWGINRRLRWVANHKL